MKTQGHYTGLDVKMVGTGRYEQIPTGRDEMGELIFRDGAEILEPGDPAPVCIPAKLMSTEEDGTVTVVLMDPEWPKHLPRQVRSGVPLGAEPVGGHATFHLLEDHRA